MNFTNILKNQKKGQIAIFIIIGIVILIIIGVLIYVLNKSETVDVSSNNNFIEIEPYIEQCIKDIAISGTKYLAARGGFYGVPDRYFAASGLDDLKVAYGVYDNKNSLITFNRLNSEFASYVDNALPLCLDNFSSFSYMNIDSGDIESSVIISANNIRVDVKFDLTVNNKKFSNFEGVISSPYGRLYGIANEVAKAHAQNPDWMDLTYLSSFDAKVNLVPINNDTFLVSIEDSGIVFLYAEKLNLNSDPIIEMEDVFSLNLGDFWQYKVECTDSDGDNVIITDDSAMIDMLEDGTIFSMLTVPGDYEVMFTCEDSNFNKDTKLVSIKVNEITNANNDNGGNNNNSTI